MPRGSKRHRPRDSGNWFDRNVKYVFLALTAIAVVSLVTVALDSVRVDSSSAYTRPSPKPVAASSTRDAALRVVFLGDSYTQGAGATTEDLSSRWSSLIAAENGWTEINLGVGGTGYSTGNGYGERVDAALEQNLDLVIVAGGRNDSYNDAETVTAAVDDVISRLRAGAPNIPIVIVSPWWDDDPAQDNLEAIIAALTSAAAQFDATYVDTGQPLEGRPDLMSADGIHPNDAGYQAIADAVQASISGLDLPRR